MKKTLISVIILMLSTLGYGQTKLKAEDLARYIRNTDTDEINVSITNASDNNLRTISRAINCSSKPVNLILEENENLSAIPEAWFYLGNKDQNKSLKSITIPNCIKIIENSAFSNCTELEAVKFSKGSQLEEIGESAFQSCALRTFEIPESVTRINSLAFIACQNLKTINIPKNIKYIGTTVFLYCDSLQGITIKTKKISNTIFVKCMNLREIKIGEETEVISAKLAIECPALTKITLCGETEISNLFNDKESQKRCIIYVKKEYLSEYQKKYPEYNFATIN